MKKHHAFALISTLVIAGCAPEQIKVAPITEPTPTSLPPVPLPTPRPVPTMTPRQKRRARAEKRRQARAEQREIEASRRRIAEIDARAAASEKAEKAEREKREKDYAVYDGKVTAEEYERVQPGMSFSEVLDIIGSGKEVSSTKIGFDRAEVRSWQNPDGSNMTAMFQNSQLVSKAQFGIL
jgi:type IV secretory pathway VirB10-like protein